MDLTPREKDKLLLFTAALLAERRKARGLKLNHPEAVAYISRFYRVFHRALLGEDRIELLLKAPVPREWLPGLSHSFADLLSEGTIQAGENVDDNGLMYPCLRLRFDRRRMGRLYQFIDHLNGLDFASIPALEHPAERLVSPASTSVERP